MRIVDDIKQKRLNELRFEDIDWGFCVPDCGSCCSRGQPVTKVHAEELANALGVDIENIAEPEGRFYRLRTQNGNCIMNYGPSICLIHDNKPYACKAFSDRCRKYTAVQLFSKDTDIQRRIKEAWLAEKAKPGYRQEAWLETAYTIILNSFAKPL
jgi:Fe-S-cluster containining protein